MNDESRREFIKRLAALAAIGIVTPTAFFGTKSSGNAEARPQSGGKCGSSYSCTGGSGKCGSAWECSGQGSGGNGKCGSSYECAGGGGKCGSSWECPGS